MDEDVASSGEQLPFGFLSTQTPGKSGKVGGRDGEEMRREMGIGSVHWNAGLGTGPVRRGNPLAAERRITIARSEGVTWL
jgi:hypothetical protein